MCNFPTSFQKGAPFRKLSFYRLWHSAQLSYKDIIKRDFPFFWKVSFYFYPCADEWSRSAFSTLNSRHSTQSYFWYITPDLHVNSVTSTLSTFTWLTMASLKSWTVPALSLVILLRIFFFSSRSSTIVAIPVPIMLP